MSSNPEPDSADLSRCAADVLRRVLDAVPPRSLDDCLVAAALQVAHDALLARPR